MEAGNVSPQKARRQRWGRGQDGGQALSLPKAWKLTETRSDAAPPAPPAVIQTARQLWRRAFPRAPQGSITTQFDLARTRILHETARRNWRRIAISPVRQGAGASFVSVNLALSMARQPSKRVVLADLNLGQPSIARYLGIAGSPPLSPLLRGQPSLGAIVRLDGAPNLAVIAHAAPEPHGAELLQDPLTATRLAAAAGQFDPQALTLFDTAPLLGGDAGLAALPLADAVLLVADGRSGTARDIADCLRLLEGMPPLLGVILNKAEIRD